MLAAGAGGAQNWAVLRDLGVFAEQPLEAVASADPEVVPGMRVGSGRSGAAWCREREQRTGKGHKHYLAAVSNTQRVLFHLGIVDELPRPGGPFRSPNGWPTSDRRSAR